MIPIHVAVVIDNKIREGLAECLSWRGGRPRFRANRSAIPKGIHNALGLTYGHGEFLDTYSRVEPHTNRIVVAVNYNNQAMERALRTLGGGT